MSENENRLIRCFSSIFPDLTSEEIRVARADTTGSWDSLTAVTLAAVIQEEFSMEIDPQTLPELDSFETFMAYILRVNPVGE